MQHGCVESNVKWNWSHSSSEYNEHPWSTCDVKEIIHSDREMQQSMLEAGREEKRDCHQRRYRSSWSTSTLLMLVGRNPLTSIPTMQNL